VIADSLVWTTTEITVTIVCVSVPTLRPLWKKWRGYDSSSAGYGSYAEQRYAEDSSTNNRSYHLKVFACRHAEERDDVDGNSDKNILGEGNTITCATEVCVAYEDTQSIQQQV
jgi:hypothetical protein